MLLQCNFRNPHGTNEWKGAWSDADPGKLWDTASDEHKAKYLKSENDGAFWMEYEDFVKNFDSFTICKIPTQYNKDAAGFVFPSQKILSGKFTEEPVSAQNKFDIVVEKV